MINIRLDWIGLDWIRLNLQRKNAQAEHLVILECFLPQAAVGWDYEGKTEAHASQKGQFMS